MNTWKTTKITSRRQYRYFQFIGRNLGTDETAKWTEYSRTEVARLLETADYDALPERPGYPNAVPKPKAFDPRPCACGECGLQFVPNSPTRKYHPQCPTRMLVTA
jgi:hypothetical protein